MTNFIKQYYQGISQQLRAEVDFINTLFQHHGIKGEGNELALRQLITNFIPKKYGVGTGIVIDGSGAASRQCDIVIYDTFHYPSLLSMSSVHLFPVDFVYAVIEVKTTLNQTTAKIALENIASVRKLAYVETSDRFLARIGKEPLKTFMPPLGFIFGYNSDTRKLAKFLEWFSSSIDVDDIGYNGFYKRSLKPSLVGCLDIGILGYGYPGISVEPRNNMQATTEIYPLLLKQENSSNPFQHYADDPEYIKLPKYVPSFPYEGSIYPVKTLGKHHIWPYNEQTPIRDQHIPIDQSQVLLAFLLRLQSFLTFKEINPSVDIMNTYVSPNSRTFVQIHQNTE